jgi:hypothetical protein
MKKSTIFLMLVVVISACGGKTEETKKKKLDYKLSKINQLVGIARIEPESKICPIGSEIPGRVVSI